MALSYNFHFIKRLGRHYLRLTRFDPNLFLPVFVNNRNYGNKYN